jgi:hypothetical protein
MAKSKIKKCRVCKHPMKEMMKGQTKTGYMCISSRTQCKESLEISFYESEEE